MRTNTVYPASCRVEAMSLPRATHLRQFKYCRRNSQVEPANLPSNHNDKNHVQQEEDECWIVTCPLMLSAIVVEGCPAVGHIRQRITMVS